MSQTTQQNKTRTCFYAADSPAPPATTLDNSAHTFQITAATVTQHNISHTPHNYNTPEI